MHNKYKYNDSENLGNTQHLSEMVKRNESMWSGWDEIIHLSDPYTLNMVKVAGVP